MGADRFHHQRICHHQAAEAQVPAQQLRQHCGREGGRLLAVQGRQLQVGGHHRGHAGGDGGPEWWQLHRLQTGAAVGKQRQLQVGIAAGVAMAGEVLGAGQHPLRLTAPHEGRRQGSGGFRVFAPGAHVDHRVGRVVVHIAHRSEHPVEPQQPCLAARAVPVALRERLGPLRLSPVQPSQGQGRHQPAGPLKALAHAFLNVGAEQQRSAGPALQLLGAQAQFGGTAPQQDHAANPLGQQIPELLVAQLPTGVAALAIAAVAAAAHHHQAGQLAPELSRHHWHPDRSGQRHRAGRTLRGSRRAPAAAAPAGSAGRARRCLSRCRDPAGRSPQACGAC